MSKIYTDGWHLVKGHNDAILVKDGKFAAAIIRGVHCAPYVVDRFTGKSLMTPATYSQPFVLKDSVWLIS